MIRYYKNLLLTLSEIAGHPSLLVHAFSGCNLHCYHRFNYKELIQAKPSSFYAIGDVISYIEREKDLFEYILISGGEYLLADTEDLISDLTKMRDVTSKPIIIYTNGTNLAKMMELDRLGLVDGYHVDMKLPYHLLSEDDFDLIELTLGVKTSDLSMFDSIISAIEYAIKTDKGYSKIRSVKYPFLSESAFEENRVFVQELNVRYGKRVSYEVNDFIYEEC